MRLWLSKNSEIPVRVQLAEQIVLGIASGDLQPDEKLPSTREVARRFGIHQNTVSAVYSALTERGHLENRKGSGVFVRPNRQGPAARPRLDELFEEFLRRSEALGYSRAEVGTLIEQRRRPLEKIVVVESDPGLRNILIEELSAATGLPVQGVDPVELKQHSSDHCVVTAMYDERPKLDPLLSDGCRRVYLTANSVPESLAGRTRPTRDQLVAVVSGWDRFLSLAEVFLVAARLDPESIVARSAADPGWRKAVEPAALVICDALTAKDLPAADPRVRVFHLVSPASIETLRRMIGR